MTDIQEGSKVARAEVCAACRVVNGECPMCGTFYFTRSDGKQFGIRPVPSKLTPAGKPYGLSDALWPWSLDQVPNTFRCAT